MGTAIEVRDRTMDRKLAVAILRDDDGWRLVCDERELGRFDYRVDAEEAGLKYAKQCEASGGKVELLLQLASGELGPLDRGWTTH